MYEFTINFGTWMLICIVISRWNLAVIEHTTLGKDILEHGQHRIMMAGVKFHPKEKIWMELAKGKCNWSTRRRLTSYRLMNRFSCGWLACGREPIWILRAINARTLAMARVEKSGDDGSFRESGRLCASCWSANTWLGAEVRPLLASKRAQQRMRRSF